MPTPTFEHILNTYKQVGEMFPEAAQLHNNAKRRAWLSKTGEARRIVGDLALVHGPEWGAACASLKGIGLGSNAQAVLELLVILLVTPGIDRQSLVSFSVFVYSDTVRDAMDKGWVENFEHPRLTLKGLALCAEIGLL